MKGGSILVRGTGSVGYRHLRLLSDKTPRQVWAYPSRFLRQQELQKQGFNLTKSFAEARMKGVQACVIATDTGKHLADAKKALKVGFHVLIEKPLASDSRGAKVLLREAKTARRQIYTACVMRFSRSLNFLRKQLRRLGKIHSVRVECQSYLPDWRPERNFLASYSARKSDGGVLRDLIHEIDYTCWMFGWPQSLQAQLANHHRLGIMSEESADLWWETKDGATVSLRLDYLTRPTRRHVVICGEKGMLKWDGAANLVVFLPPKGPLIEYRIPQERDDMFKKQLESFRAAIMSGKKSDRLASGFDGFRALAVCDAARRSSRTGRREKVRY
ncbi:MAG: Inositol 2-dehydrogenase/D-chiro-inositol 3-dehydrogenase [Elusimicrobia bacterium]|nr:Inositol 2-dehydrogenase/D-chiro-inositol 3-dehydrogenase [Elusimicrobiota bacterium]